MARRKSGGKFPRSPRASVTMRKHISRQGTKGNRTLATRTVSNAEQASVHLGSGGGGGFSGGSRSSLVA
jgi:hypothetical protein